MSDYRAIWLVTKGEYADYRVVAAFENEDDAEAAKAGGLGDEVEEFKQYRAGKAPKKITVYWAFNSGGWRESVDVWSRDMYDVEESFPEHAHKLVRFGFGTNRDTGIPIVCFVGPDRDEVVAAADALLAEYGMGKR